MGTFANLRARYLATLPTLANGDTDELKLDVGGRLLTAAAGTVASGATDSGNPVKIGGVYRATPPTLTDGQRGDAQMDTRGNLKVLLASGANTMTLLDPGDATGQGKSLAVWSYNSLWNGATWDRARTANVFKPVSVAITTGTPATIWTPASGKKFRLMGWALSGSSGGTVIFYDNTGGATMIARAPKAASNGLNNSPPNLGNGYLSAAANNVLQIDSDTSSTFTGFVFGTEE